MTSRLSETLNEGLRLEFGLRVFRPNNHAGSIEVEPGSAGIAAKAAVPASVRIGSRPSPQTCDGGPETLAVRPGSTHSLWKAGLPGIVAGLPVIGGLGSGADDLNIQSNIKCPRRSGPFNARWACLLPYEKILGSTSHRCVFSAKEGSVSASQFGTSGSAPSGRNPWCYNEVAISFSASKAVPFCSMK